MVSFPSSINPFSRVKENKISQFGTSSGMLYLRQRERTDYTVDLEDPQKLMCDLREMSFQNTIVNSAINKFANFTTGSGFEVNTENESDRAFYADYIEKSRIATLINTTVRNMLLQGNCFWLKKDLLPYANISILPARDMYIDFDIEGNINRYIRDVGMANKGVAGVTEFKIKYPQKKTIYGLPYEPEQITHFKMGELDEMDMYGLSSFIPVLIYHLRQQRVEKSMVKIADEKAVPRKLVMVSGNWDTSAVERALMESEKTGDSKMIQGPAVGDLSKDMQIIDLSYGGKEMNMDYIIDHIMRQVIGGVVPKIFVGYEADINRSTGDVQWMAFTLDLKQVQKIIETNLEDDIFFQLKDEGAVSEIGQFDFNEFDTIAPETYKTLTIQAYQAGLISKNEARERLD